MSEPSSFKTEKFEVRRGADRGHADHGWLKSWHSFSFADYRDPDHVHFGPLRVINEDYIAGGQGFGTHGHQDMEIITYVLEGELAHKDSMGNGSFIRPGDVQRMSAGKGVRHSEFNNLPDATTHLLQIWIMPNVHGIAPGYEEKHFDPAEKRGQLRLIASSNGRDGSVLMHQDASLYAGLFDGAESATWTVRPGRKAYVHVARGSITVNGLTLSAGDALKISDATELHIGNGQDSEILLFDLGD